MCLSLCRGEVKLLACCAAHPSGGGFAIVGRRCPYQHATRHEQDQHATDQQTRARRISAVVDIAGQVPRDGGDDRPRKTGQVADYVDHLDTRHGGRACQQLTRERPVNRHQREDAGSDDREKRDGPRHVMHERRAQNQPDAANRRGDRRVQAPLAGFLRPALIGRTGPRYGRPTSRTPRRPASD